MTVPGARAPRRAAPASAAVPDATGRSHEMRSTLWTPGSLIILYMAGATLFAALGA